LKFELDNQTSALVTEETSSLSNKEALQEVMLHKFNSAESKQFLSSVLKIIIKIYLISRNQIKNS